MKACLVVCCLSVAPLQGIAQETVSALAGTLTAIDAAAKTITVKTDDGSEGLFKDDTDSKVKIEFDKNLRAQTTAADAFAGTGRQGDRLLLWGGQCSYRCGFREPWLWSICEKQRNGIKVRPA